MRRRWLDVGWVVGRRLHWVNMSELKVFRHSTRYGDLLVNLSLNGPTGSMVSCPCCSSVGKFIENPISQSFNSSVTNRLTDRQNDGPTNGPTFFQTNANNKGWGRHGLHRESQSETALIREGKKRQQ